MFVLGMSFAVCPAYCSSFFVAPDGNDSSDGSIDHPFRTIGKAVGLVQAGDTIHLRGGQYDYISTIAISKSGLPDNRITLQAYQNEVPILDFSGQPRGGTNRGIQLSGSYWHLKSFTVRYAGDNGVYDNGSYNIFEQLVTYGNQDSGLQLYANSSGSPSYNQVINCDSYLNYDQGNHGENADGFAVKGPTGGAYRLGPGNILRGCRAWSNSDDGFDLWWAGNGVRIEDCWAFRNGVNIWGDTSFQGDGQGFKLGQGGGAHIVIRCLAYEQQYCGFDLNRATTDETGVTIYNCTGVKNEHRNFYFTNPAAGAHHVLRNNISYLGSVTIDAQIDDEYNSWNGFTVSDADFASLDPNGIDGPRQPDGGLPKLSFLRLSTDSPLIDAGTDAGQPFYGDAPDLGAFEHLDGDCQPDGDVDWADMWCLASNWLDIDCGDCNGADFDSNAEVNSYDFAKMADNWLN